MTDNSSYPRLTFEGGFDEREAFEARARGYRDHVIVELDNSNRYPVVFYDAVRLKQDLEDEARLGNPFLADPGLIVLQEVTEENMRCAVAKLVEQRFFDGFKPLE